MNIALRWVVWGVWLIYTGVGTPVSGRIPGKSMASASACLLWPLPACSTISPPPVLLAHSLLSPWFCLVDFNNNESSFTAHLWKKKYADKVLFVVLLVVVPTRIILSFWDIYSLPLRTRGGSNFNFRLLFYATGERDTCRLPIDEIAKSNFRFICTARHTPWERCTNSEIIKSVNIIKLHGRKYANIKLTHTT